MIDKSNQKIIELENRIDKIDKSIDENQKKYEFDKLISKINQFAFLTPGSDGYSTVSFDLGTLTVSLNDIKPYANGSKITLEFGNPLATTNNGNASMGLVSANCYHVMNFRHLDNNGFNSQFVLPLNHNGQAAWRLSSGTTWKPWNYIFDDNHAMVPASNNAYNIGSTSNYWATGYINTLYVAGNAYANGSKRIPTTGNTSGTIGSATVPVYSDGGVLKTITSYSGNAATATVASSANKLNTSAGGNTNPIYFTNGVPVRSTASVGSANQPVYLNNGVF